MTQLSFVDTFLSVIYSLADSFIADKKRSPYHMLVYQNELREEMAAFLSQHNYQLRDLREMLEMALAEPPQFTDSLRDRFARVGWTAFIGALRTNHLSVDTPQDILP